MRRLIDAGVDARRAYGNDLTALMWAAGHEDGVGTRAVLDVIPLLLEAGAPIDAADNRGRTALMIAAELGRGAIVEALLARGADRSIADKDGKRAFELAANEERARKARSEVSQIYCPARYCSPAMYCASASRSSTEVASIRSVMPGLLPRARVRNSIID